MAPAHAGCADDPDPVAEPATQTFEQLRRTGKLTAQAVANTHGQRRGRRLAVHDDVEMSIERGDLVDLDEGEPHLLGQRRQMPRLQTTQMVLQEMQVLDQQVATPLAIAEQHLHLCKSRRIDLPPLRMIGPAPPARARVDAPVVPYRSSHFVSAASPSPPLSGEREGPAHRAGG